MQKTPEDSERWQRVWELFHTGLEQEPSARAAYLEKNCGSDQELRHEVEELLAAHNDGSSLLDEPAFLGPDAADRNQPEDDFELGGPSEPRRLDRPGSRWKTSQEILNPTEVLAGRFEIVRFLGQGGTGVVYEALDSELGTAVALKALRPEIALDAEAQERFHREINLARRVTHPNACRIFDLFHHGEEMVFLTMELLEGDTLAERLRNGGPMTTAETLPIVQQVAGALSAAHEVGVVHRDLKSSNVMLVPGQEGPRAVVTDFGIATSTLAGDASAFDLTRTGQLLGTPAYMAPEQLQGKEIGPATDIYALGLLMYETLTGELPFASDTPYWAAAQRLQREAPSPRRHLPDLDRKWESTILRCLRRDPGDRFQTPAAVVAALEGEGVPGPMLPRQRRRLGLVLGLAAAAVLVIAAGISWFGVGLPGLGAAASAPTLAFEERDWVLIVDFDNRTGETVFDDTLEQALERELSNSGFVNVVPPERVQDTLRLMRAPADTRVDAALGREVSRRDGGVSALVTGRVEKLGATYLLSAQLVDPVAGTTVVSLSEDAEGQAQVLPAMERLSNRLREILGEQLSSIRQSDEQLARVTTPSLRALQLYTQADLIMQSSADRAPAAALLQQAIGLDPEFASAHILLAYCHPNESDELLRHAQRALELVDTVTEVERYFIRASYFRMVGQYDEALPNNLALLRIDPDHYWANHNVYGALTGWMVRFGEAAPYAVKLTELRPNSASRAFRAGVALAILSNRPAEAEPYLRRTAELLGLDPDSPDSCASTRVCWLSFYRVHQRWLRGDLKGVLDQVDVWAQRLRSGEERSNFAAEATGSFYLALGKLEAAEEAFRITGERTRPAYMLAVNIARNGGRNLADDVLPWPDAVSIPTDAWRVVQSARAGRLDQARRLLSSVEARASDAPLDRRPAAGPYVDIARIELALAEGRYDKVMFPVLAGAVGVLQPLGDRAFFDGSEAIARIRVRNGQPVRASRALEVAARQRNRTYSGNLWWMLNRPKFAHAAWMSVQWRLAQLYRELGRVSQARAIEVELRELLVYADPDLWLLRQLQHVEDPAADPSPS